MMQRASAGFRRPRTKILVGLVSLALVVAACGGDDDSAKATAPSSSPSSGTPTDTSNGTGVTAGSIKVGISMVDFDAIKQFVDFNHGNQRKAYEAFIADINKNGGINGRKLVPVYESFSPIGSAGASGVCTLSLIHI